jgi:hypothetical protein
MFSGHVYGSHEAPVEKAVNESGKNSRFDKIFMVIFFGDGSESLINDVKFFWKFICNICDSMKNNLCAPIAYLATSLNLKHTRLNNFVDKHFSNKTLEMRYKSIYNGGTSKDHFWCYEIGLVSKLTNYIDNLSQKPQQTCQGFQ